ncbi:MAG TPA: CpsB/CapC family capsule biosynthesis tyrosine phosphatase [Candidatus Methanoperedens sp.]|nr:CpsB/CapC family capsule biosynthesis tyrosine phosphatase [Candidatus Methanoperedens sp.]
MIDLHCHLLPGIDDGPETITDALAMCSQMVGDGTDTVVATPHMLTERYRVARADILRGVRNLREELAAWDIPLDVRPGADVMIASDLPALLRAGSLMTLGDAGSYVLLELPHDVIPSGLDDLLYEVQVLGITPIISHPERHFELQRRPDLLRPLIERGVLVQVTAASIEGAFGDSARRCGLLLLKTGMAHLCASDAHAPRGRKPGLSRARKIVEGLLSPAEARVIFEVNPARVLAGDSLDTPEAADEAAASPKAGRRFFWQR